MVRNSQTFWIGKTNNCGLGLLEFSRSHNFTLANTLFSHKTSRTTTWHAPNGETHNQINLILKSSINKAKIRIFTGADTGSDHDDILMTQKLRLKENNKPNSPHIRFNIEKLQDSEVAVIFKATVGERFAAFNLLHDDINTLTDRIKEVLQETAREI